MRFGVAYYPDYYDEGEWADDLRRIRDAGIERVRVGEFAWACMETGPGLFSVEWLDRFIDLCDVHDLEIMMCTPTATPPAWLVANNEEILPINRDGRRASFGGRQHRCFNAPAYIESSTRITEFLARRFGKRDRVVAWQLDNELGAEQKQCFCPFCASAFRRHLESAYGTIDELNRRWGSAFWSQGYRSWSDVPLPSAHGTDLYIKHHPSLELEFARFCSESIVRFARMQEEILRRHVPDSTVITTNADPFHWGDNLNIVELFRTLDVGGIDLYTQELHEIAFYSNYYAGLGRTRGRRGDADEQPRFWMTEYSTASPHLDGEMKVASDRGCEWFYLFKWKPFPWGQEQGIRNLLTITGRDAPNLNAIRRWDATPKALPSSPGNSIGLYYDFDSSWVMSIASWETDWKTRSLYPISYINKIYKAVHDHSLPARFCYQPTDIVGHRVVILPWQSIWSIELENALRTALDFRFDSGPGPTVVVTADFFQKSKDNVFLTAVPTIYREAFGTEADFVYDQEPADSDGIVREADVGAGRLVVLRTDASEEQWGNVLRREWARGAE